MFVTCKKIIVASLLFKINSVFRISIGNEPEDKLRYHTFWRRYATKWSSVLGFATITNQLACDNCLEFKEAYRLAKETWISLCTSSMWVESRSTTKSCLIIVAQDLQSKYDAVRCYKNHIDGVKRDRKLESYFLVACWQLVSTKGDIHWGKLECWIYHVFVFWVQFSA